MELRFFESSPEFGRPGKQILGNCWNKTILFLIKIVWILRHNMKKTIFIRSVRVESIERIVKEPQRIYTFHFLPHSFSPNRNSIFNFEMALSVYCSSYDWLTDWLTDSLCVRWCLEPRTVPPNVTVRSVLAIHILLLKKLFTSNSSFLAFISVPSPHF